MLTLSEAFRICDIGEESVFLIHVKAKKSVWMNGHRFWSTTIRNKFDMKKIRVLKIDLVFETYGPDFLGYRFTVSGITEEQLAKAENTSK